MAVSGRFHRTPYAESRSAGFESIPTKIKKVFTKTLFYLTPR
jgi:hypothetical protein